MSAFLYVFFKYFQNDNASFIRIINDNACLTIKYEQIQIDILLYNRRIMILNWIVFVCIIVTYFRNTKSR